ncbi:MAG: efflux RND transporter periplasmic adaptor subunit [Proteobacteria bacterium]|nr:efflux RND transporter periplasmic adaptor subunit [Desulfobulbaceae bacterium]MBU4152100.1 efflux RND transporter periplasmic adaptor subunit [Pseudomonadota bacterium]
MSKTKKIIVFIVALISIILLWEFLKPTPDPSETQNKEVRTAIARIWPLKVVVDATGRVVPEREVEIKCKASGEVITLPVEVSQEVKMGDLLVQLDPADEKRAVQRGKAAVTGSRAKVAQARFNLAIAERDYVSEQSRAQSSEKAAIAKAKEAEAKLARLTQLFDKKMASAEELDVARSVHAVSQAEWQSAIARVQDLESKKAQVNSRRQEITMAEAAAESDQLTLSDAEQRLADTTIVAPIDGVVSSRNVQVGQIIASGINNIGGGTAVLTLADLTRIYVLVSVDESDIGRVATGQPARITVDAYPEQVFKGEVVLVATKGINVSNVVTFEVKVEVSGDNRTLLKPEMTANVSIVTKNKLDSLLVPVTALERKKGLSWLTVLDKDGASNRRLVTIGDSNSEFVEILKGVEVGEKVVLSPENGQSRWRSDKKEDSTKKAPSARDDMRKMRLMGGSHNK